MTVPIFVINLDDAPDRRAHMAAVLGGLGLAFERIAAVPAASVDPASVPAGGVLRRPLLAAEQACFLSHRAAWERAAAAEASWSIVLEDDVHIAPDAAMLLGGGGQYPDDFAVIRLDTLGVEICAGPVRAMCGGYALRAMASPMAGMAAYAIRREAARYLRDQVAEIDRPIDEYLFGSGWRAFRRACRGRIDFTVGHAFPAPAVQHSVLSGEASSGPLASGLEAGRRQLRRLWRHRLATTGRVLAAVIRRHLPCPPGCRWRRLDYRGTKPSGD